MTFQNYGSGYGSLFSVIARGDTPQPSPSAVACPACKSEKVRELNILEHQYRCANCNHIFYHHGSPPS
jgi:rubredoxin